MRRTALKSLAKKLALILPIFLLAGCLSTPNNTDNTSLAPAAPSGLTATSLFISSIHLSWTDNSSNETGFKIERSPDGLTGWTEIHTTGTDTTSLDDTGLNIATVYYYRVCATNNGNDSSYSNCASATTGALTTIPMTTINVGDTPSFIMGDTSYGPKIGQTISAAYNLSTFEITNSVFAQFVADGGYTTQSYWTTNGWTLKTTQGWTQPGYWNDNNFNGANQPIVGVSWHEAVAFCNWRSTKEGLTQAYDSAGLANLNANGYRLPTEVEWEYGAAKGASGQAERKFAWGDTYDASNNYAVANVFCPPTYTRTADVGSISSGNTPQGLSDITGNVLEWCSDNFQTNGSIVSGTDRYYFVSDATNNNFVIRGGSWFDGGIDNVRCGNRFSAPYYRSKYLGFRVMRR